MPTIAQSAMFDRSQMGERIQPASPMRAAGVTSIVPDENTLRSPFMHCSMPVMASTYDSLTRQFYGNPRLPTTRILPVTR